MKLYENMLNLLTVLKLKGIKNSLDEILTDAETKKDSYVSLLNTLFSTEIAYRTKKRLERNMTGAHFPILKDLKVVQLCPRIVL